VTVDRRFGVFGSGYTTPAEWWKAGFVMSAVWVLVGAAWWKPLGYR
jgi:DASS family divalent anion:Na+ symporter